MALSPAPNSPPGPPSGDGRSQQDSDTVAYGGAIKPIYIGYDDRLLSATLNALDFKPLFSDRQSDTQAGVGSDFGVTTEARKIAFVLLMGVTAYRQLPKNGMIKLDTRIEALAARRPQYLGYYHEQSPAVTDDAGLLQGDWQKVRELMRAAYGSTDVAADIARRPERFSYPWSLFDVEFYAAWDLLFAGDHLGHFPSQDVWDKRVDTTFSIIKGAGGDIMLVVDTGTAAVNAAVPVPAKLRRVAKVVNRLNTVDDVLHAAQKPATDLTDALQSQIKQFYSFFAGKADDKLKARYQRDFYRRQYIHNNYTVRAGARFPSAASVIVPVRNMDLSGADAVLADTIRQNPAWAIEPDLRRANEN